MKKILTVISAFALGLLLSLPGAAARAQLDSAPLSEKPELVTPDAISMLWHHFAGQVPDFQAWAQLTDEYKKASEFDKAAVQDAKAREMEQTFSLVVPGDQFVADLPVTLSDYSLTNKGYLIENVTVSTFLKFSYAGQNFAVVPRDLVDHQWLAVEGLPAKEIDDIRAASKTGRDAVLTLFLSPKFAAPKPVTLEDGTYRVLSADVVGMAFFGKDGHLAWHEDRKMGGVAPEDAAQQKELMTLFR